MAAKGRFRSKNRARQHLGTVTIRSSALEESFEVDVPFPAGRVWSTLALDMLKLISRFQSIQTGTNGQGEDDLAEQIRMVESIITVFSEDDWWNRLMPAAFGCLDEPEDIAFLQENFLIMELVTAFFEAASSIASVAMGGEAVETALGKSPDGEAIIEGKGTTP